jgi:hypothetical protein
MPAERPNRFLRGVVQYDMEAVGWVWEAERYDEFAGAAPTLSIHDTARDGWNNRGHDRDLVLDGRTYRLDWSDPLLADEFNTLMEYLKTL